MLGEFWHSSSELCAFSKLDDIDGLATLSGFFKFCSNCGIEITKEIIIKQDKKLIVYVKGMK